VCCSVLQCVAVCCRVLQSVAVCCGVLQCVAVRMPRIPCRTVQQCVAENTQELHQSTVLQRTHKNCIKVQCCREHTRIESNYTKECVACCLIQFVCGCMCTAACCSASTTYSALQCVAVCCSVLQCVAVYSYVFLRARCSDSTDYSALQCIATC